MNITTRLPNSMAEVAAQRAIRESINSVSAMPPESLSAGRAAAPRSRTTEGPRRNGTSARSSPEDRGVASKGGRGAVTNWKVDPGLSKPLSKKRSQSVTNFQVTR